MKKHKVLIVGLVITAILVCAGVAVYLFTGTAPHYAWKLHQRYTYELKYDQTNNSIIIAPNGKNAAYEGRFTCTLKVAITPFEKSGAATVTAVGLQPGGDCSFMFGGKDLFADPMVRDRIFKDRTARVRFEETGRISDIAVRKGEDAIFKGALKLILGDLQVVLGGAEKGAAWTTTELNQYGTYSTTYAVARHIFSPATIAKRKEKYTALLAVPKGLQEMKQNISGGMEITFSRNGHVESMKGKEAVAVTAGADKLFDLTTAIDMRLVSRENDDTSYSWDAGTVETVRIGTVDIDEKKRRELIEKRIGGLTSSEMASLIQDFAIDASGGESGALLWRVTGFLQLHPEKSAELAPIFTDKNMTTKGKMLIFGVLSSAGHSEAQKVMRELLASDAAKKEGMYSIFLQNFGQIEKPDVATVDFISRMYETAKKDGKYRESTSLTMGAVTGNLNRAGDAVAADLNRRLVDELKKVKTPKDAELALSSLGNAGIASNVAAIADFARDGNDRVRASVANALRRTQTDDSEKVLFSLLGDKETLVQKQTVNSLAQYRLSRSRLEEFRDAVKNGKVSTHAYYETLQLLGRYPDEVDIVNDTLQEMKKRAPDDQHLMSRINQMLGQ